MGMFDDVIITEKNNFGLPIGCYQTKDLNSSLDVYDVLPDGKFIIRQHFTEGSYWYTEEPKQYPAWAKGANGVINIYGELSGPSVKDFNLYIEDGIVTKVTTYEYVESAKDIDFKEIKWEYEI